jgi:Ras family protein
MIVKSSIPPVRYVVLQSLMSEEVETNGQDEYTLFPTKYANGVHGYLLVYSINSRQSFEMVQTIYDKILDFSGNHDMPTVVVGQKSDLVKTDQR